MKKINQSEYLHLLAGTINEFENVVTRLIDNSPIQIKRLENQKIHLAQLNSIKWEPLLDFQCYILKLISEISELPENYFQISPAFIFESQESTSANPAAVILTNNTKDITPEKLQEIEYGAHLLCKYILKNQESEPQQSLLGPITHETERTRKIASKIASDFLINFGGSSAQNPRVLITNNSKNLIHGPYNQKPEEKLPSSATREIFGYVDGIIGHSRTVHLQTTSEGTIVVFYDEQHMKKILHQVLFDGKMYCFVIETTWVKSNKKVELLTHIKQQTEDLLLPECGRAI